MCLLFWTSTMEEQFETFDDSRQPTGLMSRSEVHKQGIWHQAANVFLFRPDGRLIIQRRHKTKDIWPDAWDLSTAEHLKPGESFLQGAIRGVQEELGIQEIALVPIGKPVKYKLDEPARNIRDYEIQQSFRGVTEADIVIQTNEVAEIRIVSLTDLRAEMMRSPETFTPWFRTRAKDIQLFS